MNTIKILKCRHSVEKTADQLIQCIEQEGWHIFANIDHGKEAEKVHLNLRPTRVILFGNPKIGTRLMQNAQSAAIDLPMKVLLMENENGEVLLQYNDMKWLKKRHNITDEGTLQEITDLVEKVCHKVAE